jgi:CubicO group peptidase (beta-lactamase class C family)
MASIRAIVKLALALTLGVSAAAAQEILSDSTDTTMRTASDPFSEYVPGPYSSSAAARNAPGTGLNKGDLPKIRRYAEHVIEQWETPGLAIGIVQAGEPFMVEGFGVRDLKTAAPVDGDTLFGIGSASKAFTTAAISMLAQDGLLNWDEPVVQYYPAFALQDPDLTEQILMRDIVSHQTGFDGPDMDFSLWFSRPPEFYSRYEIVEKLDEFPAAFPIRSTFSYNNAYYILAGVVMEEVTGKTWEEIVHERIFGPLGMNRSQTAYYEWPDNNFARAHARVGWRVKKVPFVTIENAAPTGAVISSARDMVKWLMFQLGKGTYEGEEILEAQYFEDMHGPHIPDTWEYFPEIFNKLGIFWVNTYGLGWTLSEYQGRQIIHHAGGVVGATSFTCILPEEGVGIVVLTNLGIAHLYSRPSMAPEALTFRIIDEYLGRAQRDWSTELYDVVWGE